MTDLGQDLFGEPVLRRSAFFPTPGVRRRISRDWGPGPRAFVLGLNPSDAGADREDTTSRWWNAWFQLFGFGGYDAGNLYSFVSPSPDVCAKRARAAMDGQEWHDRDEIFANVDDVVRMAKRADQVFVCFGDIAWDDDWIEHVLEAIQTGVEPWPDLWCWGANKSGSPRHPASRGRHGVAPDQQPILWRAAS